MKSDVPYLKHIRDALARIEEFTAGMGYGNFVNDIKTQSAVIRELTVVGEATKKLSAGLRQKHLNIPWRRLAGLRDVLTHRYFEVDTEEVWNFLAEAPKLRKSVESILAGLETKS